MALQKKGYNIKRIAGTSGGAIIAAAFSLGKSPEEMRDLAQSIPYAKFRDFRINNLLSVRNPSVYSGKELDSYYKDLFGEATLKDFVIDCKISVVTIVGRKRILLDRESYPDLPVWKAVRMSSTIPFIFPYLSLGETPVTDGGLDIRTGDIFPDKKHPVVVLRPRTDYDLKRATQTVDSSRLFLWSYLRVVAEYILDAVDLQHLDETEWEKTIIIPTLEVGGFSFSIDSNSVEKLIEYGNEAVLESDVLPYVD